MLPTIAVHERLLRTSEDFVWPVDSNFVGRFIIDVEFLDLKTCSVNVSSLNLLTIIFFHVSFVIRASVCLLVLVLDAEVLKELCFLLLQSGWGS